MMLVALLSCSTTGGLLYGALSTLRAPKRGILILLAFCTETDAATSRTVMQAELTELGSQPAGALSKLHDRRCCRSFPFCYGFSMSCTRLISMHSLLKK